MQFTGEASLAALLNETILKGIWPPAPLLTLTHNGICHPVFPRAFLAAGFGVAPSWGPGVELWSLQPGVCQNIINAQPLGHVGVQQVGDEVLALCREMFGLDEGDLPLLLNLEHLLDVGAVKRLWSKKHCVQDDAQAPHVWDPGVTGDVLQQLGGWVRQRPAEGAAENGFPIFIPSQGLWEAKIRQLEVEIVVEKDVVTFQVPVGKVQVVAVLDGRSQLLELAAGHALLHGAVAGEVGQQAALLPQLHHNVHLPRGGLKNLVGLDDGGVVQPHQSLHFPGEKLFQDVLGDFLLVDDLDGHFAFQAVAVGSLHLPVGAFPEGVPKAVAPLFKHHSVHAGGAAGTCPGGSCSASCAAGLCSTPAGGCAAGQALGVSSWVVTLEGAFCHFMGLLCDLTEGKAQRGGTGCSMLSLMVAPARCKIEVISHLKMVFLFLTWSK